MQLYNQPPDKVVGKSLQKLEFWMLYCEYDSTISAYCPSRVWLKYGVKRAAWLRRCLRVNELVATLTYHAHDTCIYQVWALTFPHDLMTFAMNGPLFLHNKSWSAIWASSQLASDWLHKFYCVKARYNTFSPNVNACHVHSRWNYSYIWDFTIIVFGA